MPRTLIAVSLLVALHGSSPAAQSSRFVLVAEATPPSRPAMGSEPTTVFHGRALEPSAGTIVTTQRYTLVASHDLEAGPLRQSTGRHAEWLARLTGRESRLQVSVGSGVRHEYSGQDVLLGRANVGLDTGRSRLAGTVTIERPLGGERDALDVIMGLGMTRPVAPTLAVGAEAIGEDLEGLWDPNEADGGARLFVGPSLQWQHGRLAGLLRVAAGADFRGPSALTARAPRSGFAVRVLMTRQF